MPTAPPDAPWYRPLSKGGSLQPVIREACHAELTRSRIKELEHQLTCREGDMTCVAPTRRP